MTNIPVVSAKEVIKVFIKIGYQVVRQRGSHIRLHHSFDKQKIPLTIPNHKSLGRGLLHKLLRDADLSVDEFISLLNS